MSSPDNAIGDFGPITMAAMLRASDVGPITMAAMLRATRMPTPTNSFIGPGSREAELNRAVALGHAERDRNAKLVNRALALAEAGGNPQAAEHLARRGRPATKRLDDGTLGYYMRPWRADDCFAAAIATALQIPLVEVPDPNIDVRLAAGDSPEEIEADLWDTLTWWLGKRGLRILIHRPAPISANRWIGVAPPPREISSHCRRFNSHCLVMCRGDVIFDPVDAGAYGRAVHKYKATDVTSGFTFAPTR
jgi:hypothetical protein